MIVTLRAGDPVWYRQPCIGGYGFQRDVPGEFVEATEKRLRVRLYLKSGATKIVSVHPRNVRRRI